MSLELLAIPAGMVLRSVGGWVENSFEDGKITQFELMQLLATVTKGTVIGLGLYLGLPLSGLEAAGGAITADFFINALKKAGAK